MKLTLSTLRFFPVLLCTAGNYYNFHPGSHVGQGAETGIDKIAEILNEVLAERQSTTVLLKRCQERAVR